MESICRCMMLSGKCACDGLGPRISDNVPPVGGGFFSTGSPLIGFSALPAIDPSIISLVTKRTPAFDANAQIKRVRIYDESVSPDGVWLKICSIAEIYHKYVFPAGGTSSALCSSERAGSYVTISEEQVTCKECIRRMNHKDRLSTDQDPNIISRSTNLKEGGC